MVTTVPGSAESFIWTHRETVQREFQTLVERARRELRDNGGEVREWSFFFADDKHGISVHVRIEDL